MTYIANIQQTVQALVSLNFTATPPLEPVITGTPSNENAFKFGTSNFKFEIRFFKQSWIVWESAELVSEN